MPTYTYTARNREGLMQMGELEAQDQETALTTLQDRGLIVTSVEPHVAASAKARRAWQRRLHNRVTTNDLILFCTQLATLIEAGVPLLRALQVLKAQVESRRLLRAIEEMHREIEGGKSFRDALARHPRIFSKFWVSLVETGEATGRLSATLTQLAHYLTTAGNIKSKVITAMIYPTILVIGAIGALAAFTLIVIPIFSRIYADFHMRLPALTLLVLQVSDLLRHHLLLVLLAVGGLVVAARQYLQAPMGRWRFDGLVLRLPLIGPFVHEVQLAYTARGLSTLLDSGVPILFALEILAHSAENTRFERALGEVKQRVTEGRSVAQLLEENSLFPPMMIQMVAVGEEVGELGQMLGRVAAYYEERVETYLARLATLFEPLALVSVGVVVIVIVVAMYLPIFQLAGGGGVAR